MASTGSAAAAQTYTGSAASAHTSTGSAVAAQRRHTSSGSAIEVSAPRSSTGSSSDAVWGLSSLGPARLLASLPPGCLAGHAADTLDSSQSEHDRPKDEDEEPYEVNEFLVLPGVRNPFELENRIDVNGS